MNKLKIAIQKSGRLYDDSVRLLKDCGIDLKNGVNKLKAECDNFPMEIYFLRDDDIPQYVEDAVADIGIVGENVLYEKNKKAVMRAAAKSAAEGIIQTRVFSGRSGAPRAFASSTADKQDQQRQRVKIRRLQELG